MGDTQLIVRCYGRHYTTVRGLLDAVILMEKYDADAWEMFFTETAAPKFDRTGWDLLMNDTVLFRQQRLAALGTWQFSGKDFVAYQEEFKEEFKDRFQEAFDALQ